MNTQSHNHKGTYVRQKSLQVQIRMFFALSNALRQQPKTNPTLQKLFRALALSLMKATQ